MSSNEQVARRAFTAFYLHDVKDDATGPVPWGHSWVESRWKFWWAGWQGAQSPVETECDAEDAAIARELTKNLSAQVDHIQHLKNMLSLAYQLLLDQRRPTLEQEQMIRDSFVSQLHEERQKAMPSEPEPKLCAHEWTHQTADIWCCECCGIFQRRGLPEKSTAPLTISKPPQIVTECPKCRTQLAFEGDECGLCKEET